MQEGELDRHKKGIFTMRVIIGTIASFFWELGMAIAIERGWLNFIPDSIVGAMLVAPLGVFAYLFLTHEALKKHHYLIRDYRKVSLAIFIIVFAGIGALAWVITQNILAKKTRTTASSHQESSASPSDHQELVELGKRIDKLSETLTQNPSVPSSAQLSILQNEHDKLSEKKNELTLQEREILNNQALDLKSLEEGRKKYLERLEVEKHEEEVTKQQAEISRRNAEKAAREEYDSREKRFAAPYIPAVDYAVDIFYGMLSETAKLLSKPISHDFRGTHPSIYGSAMLKDGKFEGGENIIRVGSDKEWEFHLSVSASNPSFVHKHLGFQIKAGNARVSITNEYMFATGNTGKLQISCMAGDKELYSSTCPLSEYQKPVSLALRQLIQDRYNNAKPMPPSPTPDKGASPP